MNTIRQRHRRGRPLRLPGCGATTGGCPYNVMVPQNNYPMNMIRHHHKCININPGIMSRQFFPHRFNHPPRFIQPHLPIDNLPKRAFSVLRADGDEISADLGIIVFRQPDGSSVGFLTIELHSPIPDRRGGSRTALTTRPYYQIEKLGHCQRL